MTEIASVLLCQYVGAPDSVIQRIMLVATGARMTRATFEAERKKGGSVILFLNTPEMEAMAITSPLTAIATDGLLEHGKGHPRTGHRSARARPLRARDEAAHGDGRDLEDGTDACAVVGESSAGVQTKAGSWSERTRTSRCSISRRSPIGPRINSRR